MNSEFPARFLCIIAVGLLVVIYWYTSEWVQLQTFSNMDTMEIGEKKITSNDTNNSTQKDKTRIQVNCSKSFQVPKLPYLRSSANTRQKRLPSVLIIGSKKSGTGALRQFLGIHPDIASLYTERHFFDEHYEKGLEWYRNLMPLSGPNQLTMETSAGYFARANVTAIRIYCMNPNMKLIVIVKNPVTRLISDYVHDRIQKRNPEATHSVEDLVLGRNSNKVNSDYVKVRFSLYDEHMKVWLRFFPRRNIHVVDGESFQKNPTPHLKELETFLGIRNFFRDSHFYFNKKRNIYCVSSRWIASLQSVQSKDGCLGKDKKRIHPKVEAEVIQRLQTYFIPHMKEFFSLIDQKFNWTDSPE